MPDATPSGLRVSNPVDEARLLSYLWGGGTSGLPLPKSPGPGQPRSNSRQLRASHPPRVGGGASCVASERGPTGTPLPAEVR